MIQNETCAPYETAHNATANPDDGYLKQEMVDAIENLVTATMSDHAAIAQLTSTVARITIELATETAKLVVALQTNHAIWYGHGGRSRTSHGRGAGAVEGSGIGNGADALTRTGPIATTMDVENELDPPIHYVQPRLQAQQCQMSRPSNQPHLHVHQEEHTGRGGSNQVKRKG